MNADCRKVYSETMVFSPCLYCLKIILCGVQLIFVELLLIFKQTTHLSNYITLHIFFFSKNTACAN